MTAEGQTFILDICRFEAVRYTACCSFTINPIFLFGLSSTSINCLIASIHPVRDRKRFILFFR